VIVHPQQVAIQVPLKLECGNSLPGFTLAYETYGKLNANKDNAILICHGLTATQHAAGRHAPSDPKPGWWDAAIGPGKPFDTEHYFVICINALGSFGGSSGPASLNPDTGHAYGMRFPLVTMADMVKAQALLADHLHIECFNTIAGGCMGGFQVLEWLRLYPARLARAVVISAGARVSPHTIALWKVLSDAIRSDPAWNGGDYASSQPPEAGLALASRIGSLFWMSRESMENRFGLRLADREKLSYSFAADFEVEAFLDKIGHGAGKIIDANSLLYLMRAMTYFDLSRSSSLAEVFTGIQSRTLLVSYESDWRYPPDETEELNHAIASLNAPVEHKIFDSKFGHGAFIYDFEGLGAAIRTFLAES